MSLVDKVNADAQLAELPIRSEDVTFFEPTAPVADLGIVVDVALALAAAIL